MDKLVVLALMLVTVYWADLNLVLSDLIGDISGEAVRNWTPESGVNPEELGYYYEGDLKWPHRDYSSRAADLFTPELRWPRGLIPFEISNSFTSTHYEQIFHVITQLGADACIFFDFKKNHNSTDYVYIDNEETGCWTTGVGRLGGKQIVNLQVPNCLNNGTIMHLLLHVVGFIHEHNRWERDEYITVLKRNVKNALRHNFWRYSWRRAEGVLLYDYGSIMHFSHFAFSKNGRPTIIPKKRGVRIGQRDGMNENDRKEARYFTKAVTCPHPPSDYGY